MVGCIAGFVVGVEVAGTFVGASVEAGLVLLVVAPVPVPWRGTQFTTVTQKRSILISTKLRGIPTSSTSYVDLPVRVLQTKPVETEKARLACARGVVKRHRRLLFEVWLTVVVLKDTCVVDPELTRTLVGESALKSHGVGLRDRLGRHIFERVSTFRDLGVDVRAEILDAVLFGSCGPFVAAWDLAWPLGIEVGDPSDTALARLELWARFFESSVGLHVFRESSSREKRGNNDCVETWSHRGCWLTNCK